MDKDKMAITSVRETALYSNGKSLMKSKYTGKAVF